VGEEKKKRESAEERNADWLNVSRIQAFSVEKKGGFFLPALICRRKKGGDCVLGGMGSLEGGGES